MLFTCRSPDPGEDLPVVDPGVYLGLKLAADSTADQEDLLEVGVPGCLRDDFDDRAAAVAVAGALDIDGRTYANHL